MKIIVLNLMIAGLGFSTPVGAASGDLSGRVVEAIDAGPYTYIRVKTDAGEKWAAVPQVKLPVGAAVRVERSVEMTNFNSPTLKRTFNSILFGTLADFAGTTNAKDNPHGSQMAGASGPMAVHGQRAPDLGPIKVEKATSADAFTIEQIYALKEKIKGTSVSVRGKVVKMNAEILDRNWAHLRDGSGKAADGSDDITVIMKDMANVGDVITVRGKVVLNKDLGGMYKFAVVLEDAAIIK